MRRRWEVPSHSRAWGVGFLSGAVCVGLVAAGLPPTESGRPWDPLTRSSGALPFPASWGLEIRVPAATADVGIPFPMNATVTGFGFAVASYRWTDSLGDTGSGPQFVLLSSAPANVTVSLVVEDSSGEVLRANRSVTIVPAPIVDLIPGSIPIDAGIPSQFDLQVSGGTPPYRIGWSLPPEPLGNYTIRADAGQVAIVVTPPAPGNFLLRGSVEDSWGDVDQATFVVANVSPDPRWVVGPPLPPAEVGARLSLSASLVDGSPPLSWGIVTSESAWNATVTSGSMAGPGAVVWSGVFAAPGNLTIELDARDASGATAYATLTTEVFPAIGVALSGAEAGVENGSLQLTGSATGGIPPLEFDWVVEGSVVGHGTLPSNRTATLTLPTPPLGNETVRFSVTDSLGESAVAVGTLPAVTLPNGSGKSESASPSGIDLSSLLLGAGLIVSGTLGFAAIVLVLRRRRARPKESGPSSEEVDRLVRRYLEESGGIEAATLQTLAAEEGVPAPAALASLERLRKAGHVGEEAGWEGGRLLHWQSEPPTSPTPADEVQAP